MDREMQGREMRQLAAAPDWVVGSVHAVTEDGSLLIASASGSQLGPIVSGAGHVVWDGKTSAGLRQRVHRRDAARSALAAIGSDRPSGAVSLNVSAC
jgi:hypothetical protein